MSLVGFHARNHPQQTRRRGANPAVDEMQTPPELFEPLDKRFGFTVDVAAMAHNAKCEWFYTPAENGLAQDWSGERVWCNPPYSDIEPWVLKAWGARADLVVMLVPANRTEQGWWQRHIEPFRDTNGDGTLRVEFIAKRQRFIRHGADGIKPNERPPFGVCLLIWGAA